MKGNVGRGGGREIEKDVWRCVDFVEWSAEWNVAHGVTKSDME